MKTALSELWPRYGLRLGPTIVGFVDDIYRRFVTQSDPAVSQFEYSYDTLSTCTAVFMEPVDVPSDTFLGSSRSKRWRSTTGQCFTPYYCKNGTW
jgi:hypothetical protein